VCPYVIYQYWERRERRPEAGQSAGRVRTGPLPHHYEESRMDELRQSRDIPDRVWVWVGSGGEKRGFALKTEPRASDDVPMVRAEKYDSLLDAYTALSTEHYELGIERDLLAGRVETLEAEYNREDEAAGFWRRVAQERLEAVKALTAEMQEMEYRLEMVKERARGIIQEVER
jgi:hypothetical protein